MHFPPMNERKQASGFTEAFAQAGAVRVVYGHLHGETAYYSGPQGMYDGVEYLLCSLDKLNGEPKLIVE
jgi:predicted phosphohydrolase